MRHRRPAVRVHELWHKVINLVFVFWKDGHAPGAIIIPPSLIRMLTSGGFDDPRAPLRLRDGRVSIRVLSSGGQYFIRNKDNALTPMLKKRPIIPAALLLRGSIFAGSCSMGWLGAAVRRRHDWGFCAHETIGASELWRIISSL